MDRLLVLIEWAVLVNLVYDGEWPDEENAGLV